MRILHTVAPASVGGLEEVLLRLAGGLHRRGHGVTIAGVFDAVPREHGFWQAVEGSSVDRQLIVAPGRRYLSEVSQLRTLCRRIRPHVLHTHGYRPDVIHPFAARAFGLPLVSTLHGFTGGGWKNRLYERLQVRSVRHFDAVVAVSRAMAAPLRDNAIPRRVLHVIPNAWESRAKLFSASAARRELGISPDRFHIGTVGRLSSEKAPDILLEAVSALSDEGEQPVVSFMGEGPLRQDLERRSGSIDNVDFRFHGVVPGAGRLLPGLDVFVLSSRTEGTPMVLFEAMEAGVPIVATAVGGVPDLLGPDTALLVPPENPRALADALLEVRKHPEAARERAVNAGRRLREEYAVEPWLEAYERVYLSAIRGRRTASRATTTPEDLRSGNRDGAPPGAGA